MNKAPDWAALQRQARQSRRSLLDELLESTGSSRSEAISVLGAGLKIPVYDARALADLRVRFDLLDTDTSAKWNAVAVQHGNGVAVVLADPLDEELEAAIDRLFPDGWARALALPEDLADIRRQHTVPGAAATAVPAVDPAGLSVSQRAQWLLQDAMQNGASDIHLENHPDGMHVKYRIDGVLAEFGKLETQALAEQMISRLKVMAELDIAERRIPQDGRFQAAVLGREVDFRVSIMPGLLGEDAVVRILDRYVLTRDSRRLTLDSIGFDAHTVSRLRDMIRSPYGMVLVTGPTGSGKTTTLYAAISEIHRGEDKIITIEDPVEYQLDGVLQIPVNERKGLTFARGLRSILRHDPDKIMVGEIRDRETAEIAVQAALTGHLVFTTVHANNVFDVIGRFAHMGVDAYNFVSSLTGVLAQRLVRINCPECTQAAEPSVQDLQRAGVAVEDTSSWTFKAGSGCAHCHGTGYKGRRAIVELLPLNDELRGLIVARAPVAELKLVARRYGMCSLRESALARVRAGETTLREADRVTFME